MGAIAEAITAYAQPLLDESDGSMEQMNKALALSQLCWNLALMSDDKQEKAISDLRPELNMDDDEFEDFRQNVVIPMIRRHREMFPQLHGQRSTGLWLGDFLESEPARRSPARTTASAEKYPGTDRYAPCPCNSGRKYKFCCGAKSR